MKPTQIGIALLAVVATSILILAAIAPRDANQFVPHDRQEVLFWHFWGGEDRAVVEEVVRRFNESQEKHFVRAVAMPGNNLDVKLFLAVTGGDPPDVVNQDDPIIADWAERGALAAIDELASADEVRELREWLFPAARALGEYDGRLYGLCNALDVRALYYNQTLLDEKSLKPPQTPDDLSEIARRLSAVDERGRRVRFGFLPDARRLWAWGIVFGGEFILGADRGVAIESDEMVAALDWMQSFSREFGAEQIAAFRTGDQSLPGKPFPLLAIGDESPHGRYAVIMDGQWRVRDIAESKRERQSRGLPVADYGVCPLPHPPGGRPNAGWVNGNFFVVPRGAKNPQGAWEFMKFWSGFKGHEAHAATTCRAGGWIPVSQQVVDRPEFQNYLDEQPLFRTFVELAASENQRPIPVVPGAPLLNREIINVGGQAMANENAAPRELLKAAAERINEHLQRSRVRHFKLQSSADKRFSSLARFRPPKIEV